MAYLHFVAYVFTNSIVLLVANSFRDVNIGRLIPISYNFDILSNLGNILVDVVNGNSKRGSVDRVGLQIIMIIDT